MFFEWKILLLWILNIIFSYVSGTMEMGKKSYV